MAVTLHIIEESTFVLGGGLHSPSALLVSITVCEENVLKKGGVENRRFLFCSNLHSNFSLH